MTYPKTDTLRQQVVETIIETKQECHRLHPPAYKLVCKRLTEKGIVTGYGRRFDPTTLYAFLYRSGYFGMANVVERSKVL